MAFPGRSVHERKAWEWALSSDLKDIDDTHIKQAYRVTCKPCKSGSCRVNCKWNPNCLNHLGEAAWFKNLGEEETDSLEEHVRSENDFCGLKNLGATCYVNSLLQVWFNDVRLREAMFSYKGSTLPNMLQSVSSDGTLGLDSASNMTIDSPTATNKPDTSCEPSHAKKPKLESELDPSHIVSQERSTIDGQGTDARGDVAMNMSDVIGQLQVLFMQLHASLRRVIDPTGFIDSLHLQHDRQQDAQEFRKLFLSQLSSAFQTQLSPHIAVVEDQYRGMYAYVTKCEGCGNVSAVDSYFYELELAVQGCASLRDSLTEFFKQESLDKDNQYFCAHCSSKQDAKRYIQLKSLPPVLTLQLLRFVFDISFMAKVKVTSYLTFPDELDLSGYLDNSSVVYRLSSLIVHCGPSAYAGHYIAHVKDHQSGKWWKFDDSVVEQHKKDKLIIGTQEDTVLSVCSSSQRKPRCPKDHHMSNNVYMLVYKRVDCLKECSSKPAAPRDLQDVVDFDNVSFQQSLSELKVAQRERRNIEEAHANKMKRLYAALSVRADSECYEWVTTSWLRDWISDSLSSGGQDDCEQSLLCKHNKLSFNAVTELKRVNSLTLQEVCEKLKESKTPLKFSSDMLCRVCVTQRCRELQLRQRMETDNKSITKLLKSRCTSASGLWVGKKSLQTWRKLYLQENAEHHSGNDEQSSSDPVCTENTEDEFGPSKLENKSEKLEADEQMSVFNKDLLCEHGDLCVSESRRRLVQSEVWDIFHQYFPKAKSYPALHTLCPLCVSNKAETAKENESTKSLCRLQKEQLSDLYYFRNRPQLNELDCEVYALPMSFWESWTSFVRFPNSNKMPNTLCVDQLLCQHGKLSLPLKTHSWESISKHVVFVYPDEWHKLLQWYTSQTSVTISPKTSEDKNVIETTPCICESCSSHWKPEDSETDHTTSYVYVFCPTNSDTEEQTSVVSMLEASTKSTRKRIPVGASKIKVDFSQTLLQLQLDIMNQYTVLPSEQILYLHGKKLVDPELSLTKLGLESGSVVLLKVMSEDEKVALFLKETGQTASIAHEDGFKGTGLLT